MSDPADFSRTREAMILNRLADFGVSLAEEIHARAREAETADELAKMAAAFHKVGRGVRQCLALKMKLMRDEQAFMRDFGPQMDRKRQERVNLRRADIASELEDVFWDEHEDQEIVDEMLDDLEAVLQEEAQLDTFLDEPIEHQVRRLKARFGVGRADDEDDDDSEDDDESQDAPEHDAGAESGPPIAPAAPVTILDPRAPDSS